MCGAAAQALYAADRKVIGPDPGVIHPGTVLVLPGIPQAGDRTVLIEGGRPPSGAPGTAGDACRAAAPRADKRVSARGHATWLRIMLLAAGLLIGAAFLAELVLAIARRRRRPAAANVQPEKAQSENAQSENVQPENAMPESAMPEIVKPPSPPRSCRRFVLADYDRLVVTHNQAGQHGLRAAPARRGSQGDPAGRPPGPAGGSL